MLVTFLEIIVIIIAVSWMCGVVYLISKGKIFRRFYHDLMGWHLPADEPQGFDGCSFHAHCKFCGKEIMQDSQGNWF